ncbi:hypothetical protein NHQ30_001917 [Ciborinia camelliae]|nr:hypothetical protein NHQ30_001917 [Ciborinia camelliae]
MADTPTQGFNTIIFDLGGFLIEIPPQIPKATESTSKPSLRRLMSTSIWIHYECGEIEEIQCYEMLGKKFGVPQSEITRLISEARATFKYDASVLSWIRQLKEATNGSLKIIALWRVSVPDHSALRARWGDELFSIFDEIFISSEVGIRQPELGFYRHVLEATGRDPQKIIVVDSDFQNLITACSLGMHTILYKTLPALSRTIKNILYDPVVRGNSFLNRNAKQLHTTSDCGVTLLENYVQLLILAVTGNEYACLPNHFSPAEVKQNFLEKYAEIVSEKPSFTNMNSPDDLDTTSLALQIMPPDDTIVYSMLDEMLTYVNPDGIPYQETKEADADRKSSQVYYDHTRPRVDPVCCLSVLTTFHICNRGHQMQKARDWVYNILLHRAYLSGTYYYRTAEWFLFWLHRFVKHAIKYPTVQEKFKILLKKRIQERVGAPGDALALAMRLTICHSMEVPNYQDLKTLKELQEEDGGWESGHMYTIPIVGKEVYDRGFTTALAIQAIQEERGLDSSQSVGGELGPV